MAEVALRAGRQAAALLPLADALQAQLESREQWKLYRELERAGTLTVRMYVSYFLNPPELTAKELEGRRIRQVLVTLEPEVGPSEE